MKTLVIVPAYNEQKNIEQTIRDLRAHADGAGYDILVVNDGSEDETLAVLKQLGVGYLNLPMNLGIGGSVQAGYRYALQHGYDIAIQFDGDGQHRAEYLSALMEPVASGKADIAIGSRFLQKEGFQSSGARRAGIHFLSALIRLLSGVRVLDVTSGMRAVNREYIRVYAEQYAQDYPEPEAILCAGIHGARICEVPVQMQERMGGKSSINLVRSIYYMIKVTLALLISRMKLHG